MQIYMFGVCWLVNCKTALRWWFGHVGSSSLKNHCFFGGEGGGGRGPRTLQPCHCKSWRPKSKSSTRPSAEFTFDPKSRVRGRAWVGWTSFYPLFWYDVGATEFNHPNLRSLENQCLEHEALLGGISALEFIKHLASVKIFRLKELKACCQPLGKWSRYLSLLVLLLLYQAVLTRSAAKSVWRCMEQYQTTINNIINTRWLFFASQHCHPLLEFLVADYQGDPFSHFLCEVAMLQRLWRYSFWFWKMQADTEISRAKPPRLGEQNLRTERLREKLAIRELCFWTRMSRRKIATILCHH